MNVCLSQSIDKDQYQWEPIILSLSIAISPQECNLQGYNACRNYGGNDFSAQLIIDALLDLTSCLCNG